MDKDQIQTIFRIAHGYYDLGEYDVKRRRILTPKPRRKLTPLEGRLIEALSTG